MALRIPFSEQTSREINNMKMKFKGYKGFSESLSFITVEGKISVEGKLRIPKELVTPFIVGVIGQILQNFFSS